MRLEVTQVVKRFGPLAALDGVSCSFEAGSVHAVLGENGAGKSTLMALLSGFLRPDSGRIALDGAEIPYGDAAGCKRLGIEMIHQHFTLVPEFTVEENLALARAGSRVVPLNVRRLAWPAMEVAGELGWELPAGVRVRNLPVGVRQRLEIVRALAGSPGVLILDEPTAVLSQAEAEDLFRVLRRLRQQGTAVILITHRLPEVAAVADQVTVLRRGQVVADLAAGQAGAKELAELMVGEMPPFAERRASEAGSVVLASRDLEVEGARGERAVRGVSLEIREREIFGIGGVDGNGQTELGEALAGVRGAALGIVTRPDGIGYIPPDRQVDGLALDMSVLDNLLITGHRRRDLRWGPFLSPRRVRRWAEALMARYAIVARSLGSPARRLSGGNQQRIVAARALDERPAALVASNPTRGLDVRAAEAVQAEILEARAGGTATALLTSDLEEMARLSDRRAFMSRGTLIDADGAASVVGGEA